MKQYLLDTNVVLRFYNPSDIQHQLVFQAITHLLQTGNECVLTAQVLIEFWVVATRPVDVNGLGWSPEKTRNAVEQLLDHFPLLEESSQIFPNWLDLVATHQLIGKRTHDARLVAVMLTSGISHVLTLNPRDFAGLSNITIVHPQDVLDSKTE